MMTKIARIVSLSVLCLAPALVSAQPFHPDNEKGMTIFESIATKEQADATVVSPSRRRIPIPIFEEDETSELSNNTAADSDKTNSSAKESPLHRLTKGGEVPLEEVIREAFDKIHPEHSGSSSEVTPFLKRFGGPTYSLSKGEANRLEETIQDAFAKIHPDHSSKSPLQPVATPHGFESSDRLNQHEASFLGETLRNALDKIHRDRGSTIDSVVQSVIGQGVAHPETKPMLRGSQKSPFIPIDVQAMKRYNERKGKAF